MSWYVDQWMGQAPLPAHQGLNRDSMLSNGTTDTYPSTMSSMRTSALGIDVALAPTPQLRDRSSTAHLKSKLSREAYGEQPSASPVARGHRQRSDRNLRGSPATLVPDQIAQKAQSDAHSPGGRGIVAERAAQLLQASKSSMPLQPTTLQRPGGPRAEHSARDGAADAGGRPSAGPTGVRAGGPAVLPPLVPAADHPSAPTGVPKGSPAGGQMDAATEAAAGTRDLRGKATTGIALPQEAQTPAVPAPAVAMPRQWTARAKPTRYEKETQSATAPVGDTMAEDWKAELVRGAEKLQLGSNPPPAQPAQYRVLENDGARREQERRDEDWERSGLWEAGRETARTAEDRTRREASREIAYPPAAPRRPIRAAPNGVTSVHVGVRPRLHPSMSEASLQRNQPEERLAGLGGPSSAPTSSSQSETFPDTVHGSYNQVYVSEHAERARLEYEAWVQRRAEREGSIGGEEEAGGTRDWMPKGRTIARPGQLRDQPVSDHLATSNLPVQDTPVTPQEAWQAYGYPFGYPFPTQYGPGGYTYMDPAVYGEGYWDPNYWGMMGDMQGDSAPIQSGGGSGKTHTASPDVPGKQAVDGAGSAEQDYAECSEVLPRVSRATMFGLSPLHSSSFGHGIYQQPWTGGAHAAATYGPTQTGTPYGGIGFGLGGTTHSPHAGAGIPATPGAHLFGGPGMTQAGAGMKGDGSLGKSSYSGYPYQYGSNPQSMYNPYRQWPVGPHGGQFHPYMGMGMGMGMMGGIGADGIMSPQLQQPRVASGQTLTPPAGGNGGDTFKAYDSTKAKQGRLGYYGYLEGRELAGPPPGYLPAGVTPPPPPTALTGSPTGTPGAGSAMTQTGYPNRDGTHLDARAKSPWGASSATPRARYDGASQASKVIQADLDTPYIRANLSAPAWTDRGTVDGIDGRRGSGHRRMHEGKV